MYTCGGILYIINSRGIDGGGYIFWQHIRKPKEIWFVFIWDQNPSYLAIANIFTSNIKENKIIKTIHISYIIWTEKKRLHINYSFIELFFFFFVILKNLSFFVWDVEADVINWKGFFHGVAKKIIFRNHIKMDMVFYIYLIICVR